MDCGCAGVSALRVHPAVGVLGEDAESAELSAVAAVAESLLCGSCDNFSRERRPAIHWAW